LRELKCAAVGLCVLAVVGCQTPTQRDKAEQKPEETPQVPRQEIAREQSPEARQDQPQQAAQEALEKQPREGQPEQGREAPQEQPLENLGEAAQAVKPVKAGDAAPQSPAGAEDPAASPARREEASGVSVPTDAGERYREALRRFDERLDREKFDDATASGGGGGSGAGGAGGQAVTPAGGGGSGEEGETARAAGAPPPLGEEPAADAERADTTVGGIGDRTTYEPPPDIPDGSDDDIVARQLREAAESELDPELRARLWEEYRAYKEDQQQ